MGRWLHAVSMGVALLLLISGPGGLRVQAQGEGGIIPPHEFSSLAEQDPAGARYSTNRNDEPVVAQNPVNAQNLVVAFNDWHDQSCTGSLNPLDTTPSDCRAKPGVSISGFAASFDGGSSFACRGRLNLSASGAGAGAFAFGDPSIAFNSIGEAYYGTIGFPGTSPRDLTNADVFVAKSTDGGCTWPTARNVSGNVRFDDKDAIAVDINPNSPCQDNVYLAWTELGKGGHGGPDKIVISHSTDRGQTWTKPRQLSPGNPAGRSGVAVKADNGNVWVVWFDVRQGRPQQHMAISTDCGKKFNKHITVALVNPVDGPYPGASFRVNSFPSLALAPDGNTLYVAWADRSAGHSVIKVAKSSTKGLTWSDPVVAGDVTLFCCRFPRLSASAFFPAIDVDPAGNVNLAFLALEDKPNGTPPGAAAVRYGMFVRQSRDGGTTFINPLGGVAGFGPDNPDSSSTEDLLAQFLGDYIGAVSDSAGGRLFVVWTDTEVTFAAPCPAVDAFRAGTGPKPNVIGQCPANFGNTDILLTQVSY